MSVNVTYSNIFLSFHWGLTSELETCNTVTYFQNFRNGRIETWREIPNLGMEFFKIVVDVILCFSGREA
jgi:hypothetical protein